MYACLRKAALAASYAGCCMRQLSCGCVWTMSRCGERMSFTSQQMHTRSRSALQLLCVLLYTHLLILIKIRPSQESKCKVEGRMRYNKPKEIGVVFYIYRITIITMTRNKNIFSIWYFWLIHLFDIWGVVIIIGISSVSASLNWCICFGKKYFLLFAGIYVNCQNNYTTSIQCKC